MPQLLKLLRPHSWIKNLFIFFPLFFAREFFIREKLSGVLFAFIVFCITASIVYIINDITDIEQDRKHPLKKERPLASGAISIRTALLTLVLLLACDIYLLYTFVPGITLLVILYLSLNLLYSLYLKHIAIVDILLVSSFYFIRVLVGGVASGVVVSHWLLLCVIFVSLFLIVGKRLAELSHNEKRKVLEHYSEEFLNSILTIAATLTIVSYSLYSVLVLDSYLAILSIFFVLLGIIRYVFIIFTTHKAEYPEKAIFADGVIFLSSLMWILCMYAIFYVHL